MVTQIPNMLCKILCAWLGIPNLAAGKLKSIMLTTPLAGTILAFSACPTTGTWFFGSWATMKCYGMAIIRGKIYFMHGGIMCCTVQLLPANFIHLHLPIWDNPYAQLHIPVTPSSTNPNPASINTFYGINYHSLRSHCWY